MYPIDPVVGATVCGSFALLFAVAGAHKLSARAAFEETLAGYRLLPAALAGPASLFLPALECLIAAALLVPGSRGPAALAGSALLAGYAAAMGINLLRGRRQLDCGCLGPRGGGMISGALVLRNGLMALALAVTGVGHWSPHPMGWLDIGTVLGAVCAAALLYAAANGLIQSAGRLRPERG
ncbi:MAG TPA: MauE/DoxX family redox-associated membrane protein [Steroidobacteraceae bacterium]|nr:MauE/DoxX family redox-associated membrane protein [Steroidobacteraceae bacterium]